MGIVWCCAEWKLSVWVYTSFPESIFHVLTYEDRTIDSFNLGQKDLSRREMPFIYTVVLSTKHHETIATCVSRLFVAPWTVGSQPPLSLKLSSKNTRMGSYSLLQGIFPTQRLNLGLLPCRQILYHLSHREVLYCLMSVLTLSYV